MVDGLIFFKCIHSKDKIIIIILILILVRCSLIFLTFFLPI